MTTAHVQPRPAGIRGRPARGRPHGPAQERRQRDIAPFARRADAVPLNAAQAAKQLGCAENTLFKLGYLGAIEIVRESRPGARIARQWLVYLSPASDRLRIYEDWLARVRRWNHRTAERHKDIRGACAVEPGYLQPDGLDTFAMETFNNTGIWSRAEAMAFYMDVGKKAGDRDRIRDRLVSHKWRRTGQGRRRSIDPAVVVAMFPALKRLPDTSLDPDAEDAGAPGGRVLARAAALEGFAGGASMLAFAAAASGRTDRQISAYVGAFGRVEDAIALTDPAIAPGERVEQAVRSLLNHASRNGAGGAAHVQAARLFMTGQRFLRAYASRHDPLGTKGLAALVPPSPANEQSLRRKVYRVSRTQVLLGGERRKMASDKAADRIIEHSRAAKFRMEQVVAFGQDALQAKSALARHLASRDLLSEAERMRTPAFWEFVVPTTVLDARGNLVRGLGQEAIVWAWRESDAWLSMEPDVLRLQRGMRKRRRANVQTLRSRGLVDQALYTKLDEVRAHPERFGNIVYEYRGHRPAAGGTVAHEPWFVTLARCGVDISPASLTPRRQRQRHRLMENWNLPAPLVMPSGLLTADEMHGTLFRWMDRRNRLFVPLEEDYHAYGFAEVAFNVIIETLARSSECLQIVQSGDGWTFDHATGELVASFLSRPKGSRGSMRDPEAFEVSDLTFAEIMEWAEIVAIANGHADGWLPDVEPDLTIVARQPARRPSVFQWRGKALTPSSVSYLLGSLFANRGRITPHLLRHAGANLLRELGVPERVIQAVLKHKSASMTAWYARATLSQFRGMGTLAALLARTSAADVLGRPVEQAIGISVQGIGR